MRVGQALLVRNKYENNKDYRKKKSEYAKIYEQKNKQKIKQNNIKNTQILNQFKDKHCMVCKKLLHYKTKGNLCKNCKNFKTKFKEDIKK
ncbi:MAG: hypothetical protein ACP6IY_09585 [Promethearchaeia archaeon]